MFYSKNRRSTIDKLALSILMDEEQALSIEQLIKKTQNVATDSFLNLAFLNLRLF